MATTTESSSSSNNISPRFARRGGGREDSGKGGNDRPSVLSSGWAEIVRGSGDSSSSTSESTANATAAAISSPPPPASFSPSHSITASSEQLSYSSSCIGSAVNQPSPPLLPMSAQPCSTSPDSSEDEGLDKSDSSNVGGNGAKPAWNKPSNGEAQSSGSVMGASSWPALSESARPLQKSSSVESSNPNPATDVSVSASQGPQNSNSSPKQGRASAHRNSNSSHAALARERSMKRGGNRHDIFPRGPAPTAPPPPPPRFPRFPRFPIPHPAPNSFRPRIPIMHNPSQQEMRGPAYQSCVSGERPPSRPGRLGQPHFGEGPHSNHYEGRGGRNRGRGFVGTPSQGTSPYISQQPVTPYGNTVFYVDEPLYYYFSPPPMDSFTSMHFVAPPPSPAPPGYLIPYTVPDPSLRLSIVKQIDYYFSHENLVKDEYLKTHMDSQGWVPIELIAGFNKVKILTQDISLILDSLRESNVVEVQGNKIRKRDGWEKWILRHLFSHNSGSESPSKAANEELAISFQKTSLEEATTDQANVAIDAESCNNNVSSA